MFYRATIQTLVSAAFLLLAAVLPAADMTAEVEGDQIILGKAGIGTSSAPASPLHVYQSDTETGNAAGVTIQQAGAGNTILHFIQSLTSTHWALGIDKADSNKFKISNPSNGTLTSNPRVTIDTSGKVGIGMTSPSSPLSVNGGSALGAIYSTTAGAYNFLDIDNTAANGDPGLRFLLSGSGSWILGVDNSDSDKLKIGTGSLLTSANKVTIDTSGNVGIGTTSPLSKLHVEGDENIGTTAGGTIRFKRNDGYHIAAITSSADNSELSVCSNGGGSWVTIQGHPTTGHVRINPSGGKVGIGTNSPLSRLHVVAADHSPFTNQTDGFAATFKNTREGCSTPGCQGGAHLGIKVQAGTDYGTGTNYMMMFYSGHGTDYSDLKGTITIVDGVTHYNTTSDARLKTDIVDTHREGLAMVRNLPVRDFSFIDSNVSHTGFIAQEVEAVYPEAVDTIPFEKIVEHHNPRTIPAGTLYNGVLTTTTLEVDEVTTETVANTVKTISPMMLIPILWKAVQEQQAQKDDLDTKWKTYEERLVALEEAQKASAAAAASALVQEVGLTGSAAPAVDDETVKKTADAVLKELGINPWVEITMAEAWEEVEETVPTEVVKTVTKYRPNWETMATETYTVEEKVVEKTPTGRKIKQLRPDARFDEKTGKYYRRMVIDLSAQQKVAGAVQAASRQALLSRLLSAAKLSLGSKPISLKSEVR